MKFHKPSKKIRIRITLPYILGIMVIGLLLIQVIVSNHLALSGTKINQTETKIGALVQENSELNEKVASASALLTIKSRAQALGFIRSVKPIYLSESQAMVLGNR